MKRLLVMNRALRRLEAPASFLLILSLLAATMPALAAQQTTPQSPPAKNAPFSTAERAKYEIRLRINFDALSFTGSERVRWNNGSDHSTSILYFHLYSNLRVDVPVTNYTSSKVAGAQADEPRVDITGVRQVTTDVPLNFAFEDHGTTLRVNLREAVPPKGWVEVAIDFKGSVPEIDPEETGITTHIIKQVSAALRGEREIRRARDINFRCRGLMLLGTFYPVLAVHDGDEWRRKLEPSVGDMVFNEAADYQVTVEVNPGVEVFTSGTERGNSADGGLTTTYAGASLRDFAIIAGRGLRFEQIVVGNITLRSIFLPEHEKVGKQVLTAGANALRIFAARFGPLPLKTINIAEAPLVAGLGSAEFAGLDVIASAFYVDFDSPAMRNLPQLVREQRASVEQSLEWTAGHLIAHQWWGAAVGNDPAREPVLDEALSSWSALLYYKERYGEQLAAAAMEDQLVGVYRVYRTFGGEDMEANRPSRDYRNSLQYAAIVLTKGAVMFVELRRLLGEERFFAALQSYYKANLFEIADMEDLRGALIAEAPLEQRRTIARTFNRWLSSKRGDEDIGKPDQELATSLGLSADAGSEKTGDRRPFTAFARLGKFFWQQMTRIR